MQHCEPSWRGLREATELALSVRNTQQQWHHTGRPCKDRYNRSGLVSVDMQAVSLHPKPALDYQYFQINITFMTSLDLKSTFKSVTDLLRKIKLV